MDATIEQLLRGHQPDEVCFWSGAGISIASPTSLPGGVELTERLIDWAFADDPMEVLCGPRGSNGRRDGGLYQQLRISNRLAPRLEVVLGVASEPHQFGVRAFHFALRPMYGALPNPAHAFLHAHLTAGGRHLTANFDTCIERAGPRAIDDRIFHFHGSLHDELTSLGATFRNIERGFTPELAVRFLELLRMPLVVVVGYSGSDVFDVAPLLAQLGEHKHALKGTTVLWIAYARGNLLTAPDPSPLLPADEAAVMSEFLIEERVPWVTRQLEGLRSAGAVVHYVSGDPDELYQHLINQWQLQVPTPDNSHHEPPPPEPDRASTDERTRATVRLWQTMGLNHRALQLMEATPSLFNDSELVEARAATAWIAGKYRLAARHWRRRPRNSAEERANWDERQIACRWVAGRFASAVVRAHFAVQRARKSGVINFELLAVYARTVQHMQRTPDLHWLAVRLAPAVRRQLDDCIPGPDAGEHLRIGFESARRAIDGDSASGETLTTARSRFTEAESLIGVVNYRHGRLRRLLEEHRPADELIEEQAAWADLLHASGDARRSAFLPGAALQVGMWWRVRAVFGNQYGAWHRCRLLGKVAVDAISGQRPRKI